MSVCQILLAGLAGGLAGWVIGRLWARWLRS
jgi:ABC-type lipoprotein release transport system permease subunit